MNFGLIPYCKIEALAYYRDIPGENQFDAGDGSRLVINEDERGWNVLESTRKALYVAIWTGSNPSGEK